MKKIIKNRKGFTLVEIIVVLLILGILAAISIPSFLGYVDSARDSEFMVIGRSINTEASTALQKEVIKNPDMSNAKFDKVITEFKRKYIWSGKPGSKNPINEYIDIQLPDFHQIRSIEFNFDDMYSQNDWIYDKNRTTHTITKTCIILEKTETAGTQKPLQEFVYIVILANKNTFVYDSHEEAMEAYKNNPEEGPIFPT